MFHLTEQFRDKLIAFGDDNLPIFFHDFYIRLIQICYDYPFAFLFILLILFLILNIILIIMVLRYTNRQKNRKDRYIRIFTNHYEEVIRQYLFKEIDWEQTLVKLKRHNKNINRKIIMSVLVNFLEMLRGDLDTEIPEIYYKLGLYNDSIKGIKSKKFHRIVQGIRELTNFYPALAVEYVPQYINNSNDMIGAEAQASYILLHPNHPFEFLMHLTRPFTRWTQMTAFFLFRKHQYTIPSFAPYLEISNYRVQNFSLRMIIYFQQLECAEQILSTFKSPVETTRCLCIRAINDLRLLESKDMIKNSYPTETPRIQQEIIKALRNIGSSDDYDFLINILESGSVTLKTEACRTLYFMNSECRDKLILLSQGSGSKIEPFIEHITDPRN